MNVFHKAALESLKKNRTRTLITIIGVVLSAALFAAVATLGTSLLHYLILGVEAKTGGWCVEFPAADAALVQQCASDPDTAQQALVQDVGYAVLDGAKSADKPYLWLAGFDAAEFDQLPVTLISGRMPQNDHEVLVPNHVLLKAGVSLPTGQQLTLQVGQRWVDGRRLTQHDPYTEGETLQELSEKTYTVVGTYARPGYEEHEAPGYTLITCADGPADSGVLFVTLRAPRKSAAFAARYAGYEPLLNTDLLRFYGASENRLFNALLLSVGSVVAVIIMIGSMFLIYNAFNISLGERTREFGVLMSVGATARQLRGMVMFESLCLGAAGIPLGIALGVGGMALLLPMVQESFGVAIGNKSVVLELDVSAPMLLAAALFTMVTILLSAYLPARRAVSMPVMDCIRDTGELQTDARSVRTPAWVQRFFGLEGTLALKSFRRSRRRSRSVIFSLVMSVVLFISGTSFRGALEQMSNESLKVTSDSDILFQTSEMQEADFLSLYERMRQIESVTSSTWQKNITYTASGAELPAQEIPVCVQIIDDEVYYDFLAQLGRDTDAYRGENAWYLAVLITADHQVCLTEQSVPLTLYGPAGQLQLTAAFEATYPQDPLSSDEFSSAAYMMILDVPRSLSAGFEALGGSPVLGAGFVCTDPNTALTQMQAAVNDSGFAGEYLLFNMASALSLTRSLTFVVQVFTVAFTGMLTLISVANVFNTITTNIRLRRRELSMLRSVGMGDAAFGRMMRLESSFYVLRTMLFAVPISGILSWGIYKVIGSAEELERFTWHFPLGAVVISLCGVACIVFAAMAFATRQLRRENILDALRDGME